MRRVTLMMAASFLLVQIAALAVGTLFIAQNVSVVENPSDAANAGYFFVYVLLSAAVLLIVLKLYRGNLLFLGVELALLFFSTQVLFMLFLPILEATILAAAAVAARLKFPQTRPGFLLAASAIVGALLGSSLDILPAVIFSSLLAAYDVVAVFYTGHMVALAKGLNERGAAFSVQISAGKGRTTDDYEDEGEEKVATTKPYPRPSKQARTNKTTTYANSARPSRGIETIELGTGDLVIPAMISVSALKLSPIHAGAALAGAIVGISALLFILEKQRGYWPALPPIVFGAVGFLAAFQALLLLGVV